MAQNGEKADEEKTEPSEAENICRLDLGQSETGEKPLGSKYGSIFFTYECRAELMEVDGARE